jgi:hypothetical protein
MPRQVPLTSGDQEDKKKHTLKAECGRKFVSPSFREATQLQGMLPEERLSVWITLPQDLATHFGSFPRARLTMQFSIFRSPSGRPIRTEEGEALYSPLQINPPTQGRVLRCVDLRYCEH